MKISLDVRISPSSSLARKQEKCVYLTSLNWALAYCNICNVLTFKLQAFSQISVRWCVCVCVCVCVSCRFIWMGWERKPLEFHPPELQKLVREAFSFINAANLNTQCTPLAHAVILVVPNQTPEEISFTVKPQKHSTYIIFLLEMSF
jgi:hypothetical protein